MSRVTAHPNFGSLLLQLSFLRNCGLIALGILDVCIIELGGTVGDIESHSFVESMRQLRMKAGSEENFVSGSLYSSAALSDK